MRLSRWKRFEQSTSIHIYRHRLLCTKMADAWANELNTSPRGRDENALYSSTFSLIPGGYNPSYYWIVYRLFDWLKFILNCKQIRCINPQSIIDGFGCGENVPIRLHFRGQTPPCYPWVLPPMGQRTKHFMIIVFKLNGNFFVPYCSWNACVQYFMC